MTSNIDAWSGHVEMLKSLWERGWTATQVATELNRHGGQFTRNAILGKIHRLGIAARPYDGAPSNPRRPPKKRRATTVLGRQLRLHTTEPAPRYVPPPIPADAPAPRNLGILELKPTDCRYPVNDGPEYLFCAHPVAIDGRPYCPFHMKQAHA